jgi:DUF1680 family protein
MEINSTRSPYAHLKTIQLKNVSVRDGFWSGRQSINHEISLKHAYQKLKDSGNFNNLKLAAGTGEGAYRKPVFMDSDIYKWLEAVSPAGGWLPQFLFSGGGTREKVAGAGDGSRAVLCRASV